MRQYTLNRIMKMPHLADFIFKDQTFTPEKMITDLGLYEAVVIDTLNILCKPKKLRLSSPNEVYTMVSEARVSEDVQALHRFWSFDKSIMLPCAECRRDQAFSPKSPFNPQVFKLLTKNNDKIIYFPDNLGKCPSNTDSEYETSNNLSITYVSGSDYMNVYGNPDYESVDIKSAALSCVEGIGQYFCEIRRDFVCALNNKHRICADFIIHKATDVCKKPNELVEYKKRKNADPSTEMNDKEKKVFDEYEKIKYCLILEKVGQEPSMADLQMFDIEKYRKVLSSDRFRDFSMALGLYASGVGCGSLLYLRRILESIVEKIKEPYALMDNWNQEEYSKKRFNEQVEYLESLGAKIIPNELSSVKNKIYGWLSKGVHELSEDESKELFSCLKYSIELILDEQLMQKEKEAKLEELQKKLNC